MTDRKEFSIEGPNSGTSGNKAQNAGACDGGTTIPYPLCGDPEKLDPFPNLFSMTIGYGGSGTLTADASAKKIIDAKFKKVRDGFRSDPFIETYRKGVPGYFGSFMKDIAPQIEEEIKRLFNGKYPKYMVTTGIGANELFTRFAASINNKDKDRRLTWFVLNSPKELPTLPRDANAENTLFLEFSRSGVAEETIKIHEYTPRNAKRIIFTNGGPLEGLAKRDGNLVLGLPEHISGRYGRNKTPILLAPMFVAGMDVRKHWEDIEKAIETFDISDMDSLPFVIAKFIYCCQKANDTNMIYLGCNDSDIGLLGDQFLQFWNEGVNRKGNDILVSKFFGLPRDSHMNIEGILGNHLTKIGFFLLRTNLREQETHPLISAEPEVFDSKHKGLRFGDEDVIFAMANYRSLYERMPTILIEIQQNATMELSAALGQLFADITFIYSRIIGVDPGTNPEVSFIREKSSDFLSSAANEMREKGLPIEKAARKLT